MRRCRPTSAPSSVSCSPCSSARISPPAVWRPTCDSLLVAARRVAERLGLRVHRACRQRRQRSKGPSRAAGHLDAARRDGVHRDAVRASPRACARSLSLHLHGDRRRPAPVAADSQARCRSERCPHLDPFRRPEFSAGRDRKDRARHLLRVLPRRTPRSAAHGQLQARPAAPSRAEAPRPRSASRGASR